MSSRKDSIWRRATLARDKWQRNVNLREWTSNAGLPMPNTIRE